jgi:hypothetical protein
MKIKAANAAEYAKRLVGEEFDLEIFNDLSLAELRSDFGFAAGDIKRVERYRAPYSPTLSASPLSQHSPRDGNGSPEQEIISNNINNSGGGGGGSGSSSYQQFSPMSTGS